MIALMPKINKSEIAKQLAESIDKHLKRFERDPKINKKHKESGTSRFWQASATEIRGKVHVCFVGYQGGTLLEMEEAHAYSTWLDEGNVGALGEFEDSTGFQKKQRAAKLENLCYIAEEKRRPRFTDPAEKNEATFGEDFKVYETLRLSYYAVLESFAPKVPRPSKVSKYGDAKMVPFTERGDFYPSGFSPTWHQMTPEQQKKASLLYEVISEAISTAYERGLSNGRDLLGQLARGDVSVGEFEKRKVATPRKRRDEEE
jgi:hypothetical protein